MFFSFFFLKESKIQLGPRDRGDDSWLLLLGLHSDSDPRRVYLLQAGCKQVTIPMDSVAAAENQMRLYLKFINKEYFDFCMTRKEG